MSKTAHTPGPWEFGKDRRWLFRDDLKADGNFSSSTILKINDDAFRPSEADAHLIAAAPDMYAELDVRVGDLVMLRKAIEAGDPKAEILIRIDDMLRETRAVIAKAEGRS